jgi:beta-galactosidase
MKNISQVLKVIFAFALFLLPLAGYAQNDVRILNNFDFDWKFKLADLKEAASQQYDDAQWEDIQLPHDWSIKQPISKNNNPAMGFLPGGIGWYRKTFTIPDEYKNKTVKILFDGVYHQSDVFINGKYLGFHPYGYIGFEYDLSSFLNFGGKNTISVRVDHSNCPSSRWYSGSGIYRHAWLIVTDPVKVSTWGTYVTTPVVSKEAAEVKVETTVENNSSGNKEITLKNRIIDTRGKEVSSTESTSVIKQNESQKINQVLRVQKPDLWSIETPNMYRVESIVKIGNKVIDTYTTPFGIRYFKFDPEKGFFLNGENIKLKGMCLHQDAGSLGTAVPDRSYGCNAIRCSHNPPSPEFLDMCDRMGFVVIDEAFDKWESGYYKGYFPKWWKKDLGDMLQRDRNHPSIIIWSVGNEVSEQNDTSGKSLATAKMLQGYVHETEPTRPVTIAIAPANVGLRPYNSSGFTGVLDIVGYNYQEPWLLRDKGKYPGRIMFISEAFPYYTGRSNSLRDYKPLNPWYMVADNNFVFGQFIWAGVDYLGESSGWPSTGWPTGPFDDCMFEKSRAAFHRAMWNPEPMVRIAVADQSLNIDPGKDHWSWPNIISHWNFPQYKGQVIEVQTITNCDSVELWVNKASMGKRRTSDYSNNTIVWHVPYREGKIEAKGYNNATEAAKYELNTSGSPAKIVLSADRTNLIANGQDLSHISISIVDDQGILVPNADKQIIVEISGGGRLLGIDNGDLRRDGSYNGNKLPTYFGKALMIVQSFRNQGEINIRVTAEGLPEATCKLKSEQNPQ